MKKTCFMGTVVLLCRGSAALQILFYVFFLKLATEIVGLKNVDSISRNSTPFVFGQKKYHFLFLFFWAGWNCWSSCSCLIIRTQALLMHLQLGRKGQIIWLIINIYIDRAQQNYSRVNLAQTTSQRNEEK